MENLNKKASQDRSKINMHEAHEVKYWTKELGVNQEQLQKLVQRFLDLTHIRRPF